MNPASVRRSPACCVTKASTSRPSAPARSASSAWRSAPTTWSSSTSGCPGIDGLTTLQRLGERQVDAQVVIISGHGNIESAVRAIKMGAFDFIEKPLSLEKTMLVVRNALRQRDLETENRALRARVDRQFTMVGRQPADAAPARAGGDGGADQRPGADPRRERHRQGTGGPHHSSAEPPAPGAVRRGELRRDPRRADRDGAVRPRARAPSPARSPTSRAASSRPTAARSSSTRSAT